MKKEVIFTNVYQITPVEKFLKIDIQKIEFDKNVNIEDYLANNERNLFFQVIENQEYLIWYLKDRTEFDEGFHWDKDFVKVWIIRGDSLKYIDHDPYNYEEVFFK